MSSPDLDVRIAVFQREMRRQILWLLLLPAAVCFIAYMYATYLRSPGATLVFWPIPCLLIGGAVIMSLLVSRLVDAASVRADLVCEHCGAALGGYVKQLKRTGRCPKCDASLLESV
jgi:hypothetical protein